MPRLLVLACVIAACAHPALAQAPAPNVTELIKAYPQHLVAVDGNTLVWLDGTRMMIDEGRTGRDHETMLTSADLKDMITTPYPLGRVALPPAKAFDPGRARNPTFFNKMYGNCVNGEVVKNLIDVPWLPNKGGGRIKATTINGVAEKFAAVSRELDALPSSFDRFLLPPGGTYACRPIAGTTRVSAHGHGIAIDIATATTDYWRWHKGDAGQNIPYKNRVPFEIVEIFERHGFIWGGKWYHYDTMHFEYRPELLRQ